MFNACLETESPLDSVSSHDLWVTKQIICSGGSGSRWKCGIWLSADFTLMLDNNIFYIYTTTKPDSDPRDALCWCQDPWARTRAHALFCFKAPDDDESLFNIIYRPYLLYVWGQTVWVCLEFLCVPPLPSGTSLPVAVKQCRCNTIKFPQSETVQMQCRCILINLNQFTSIFTFLQRIYLANSWLLSPNVTT